MLILPISFVIIPVDPCMKYLQGHYTQITQYIYNTTQTNSNQENTSTCRTGPHKILIITGSSALKWCPSPSLQHPSTDRHIPPNLSHVSGRNVGLTSAINPKCWVKSNVPSRHRVAHKSCQNSAHRRTSGIKSSTDVWSLSAVSQ